MVTIPEIHQFSLVLFFCYFASFIARVRLGSLLDPTSYSIAAGYFDENILEHFLEGQLNQVHRKVLLYGCGIMKSVRLKISTLSISVVDFHNS